LADTSEREDIDLPRVVAVAVILVVIIYLSVAGLEAWFYRAQEGELQRKVYSQTPETLAKLKAQQEALLHSYRWIDQNKGTVAIPIERAMELVVKELGSARGENSLGGASPRLPSWKREGGAE